MVHYLNHWFEIKIDRPLRQSVNKNASRGSHLAGCLRKIEAEADGNGRQRHLICWIFLPASARLIGLSDFARLAGLNKATCHRLLTELMEFGLCRTGRAGARIPAGAAGSAAGGAARSGGADARCGDAGAARAGRDHRGNRASVALVVGRLQTLAFAYSRQPRHGGDDGRRRHSCPFTPRPRGLAVLAFLPDALRERGPVAPSAPA